MKKDLTKGSVLKNILVFSLPFLLSYFMQTLYGLADLFIIGQFCKTEATTAVSIGSQVMHLTTVVIVGLAMGSTVLIGNAVGSKDTALRNKAIGNTVTIFAIFSIIFTSTFLAIINILISVMATPAEAIAGTKEYLIICFIGIPFITFYNVISSVFRGMGDSKSPMYFIAVACFFNILLDYIFIGILNLGPRGAALGTTLSQTISVLVSLIAIIKNKMIDDFHFSHLSLDSGIAKNIIRVGIPVAAQDTFIQISFIVITIFANRRGLVDAAAVGVVEKLIGILFLVPSSLLSSVSALCALNIGANEHERARQTMIDAAIIAFSIGMFFSIIFQFISQDVIRLFIDDPLVIAAGSEYMHPYVFDCAVAGIHFVFSGYFCALSRSELSFIHNVISVLIARIPIAYFTSIAFPDTLFPMGLGAPIGSALSVVICLIMYVNIRKSQHSSN